MQRIYLS